MMCYYCGHGDHKLCEGACECPTCIAKGKQALSCTHCGWTGVYAALTPLGSLGRLHCPECYAEYGTRDGVQAPGMTFAPLDSGFFRKAKV